MMKRRKMEMGEVMKRRKMEMERGDEEEEDGDGER